MSIESFIQALPKVELGLQFEGCVSVEAWRNVADLNEVNLLLRAMRPWVAALENPDVAKLDELYGVVSQWAKYPEDVIRMVYDIGVMLHKQNVKYAEIGITPTRYMTGETSFEEVMEALSDGRDRAKRGWGVEMAWVFNIPRDEARRGDEIVRLANSTIGRRHNVVGVALSGTESAQQLAGFERSFATAAKRPIVRAARTGEILGGSGIVDVVKALSLTRIISTWPVASDEAVMAALAEAGVAVTLPLSQVKAFGGAEAEAAYPLRQLLDSDVRVTLTANATHRLKTNPNEQYLKAVKDYGATADDLAALALNGVHASGLQDEQKQAMLDLFKAEIAAARSAHLG
jgi:adenosine deaminase